MKLIIDIPEERYKEIIEGNKPVFIYRSDVAKVLANGIQLPKNHGALKDMGNLKYVFDLTKDNPIYSGKDIARAIKSMTTIIEANEIVEEKDVDN